MSIADNKYKDLITTIAKFGYLDENEDVRGRWESDNAPAHCLSVISYKMRYQPDELPLITSKFTAWKTAVKEMLWIWQLKSNNVDDLNKIGVKIWDNWKIKKGIWKGTIAKAYGYQLGKISRNARKYPVKKLHMHLLPKGKYKIFWWTKHVHLDQVDYLIHELINNPASKRHVVELWNPDDIGKMALTPCFHKVQLHVQGSTLHMELRGRSSDTPIGLPFNLIQYNVLLRLLAQVCKYKVGEFIVDLGNAHIYSRHLEEVLDQVNGETFEQPEIWINPDIKSFYDFTIDDIKIVNYKYGKKRKYEIVV